MLACAGTVPDWAVAGNISRVWIGNNYLHGAMPRGSGQ